jgi:nucleotide-binding universal stress UspA family protein
MSTDPEARKRPSRSRGSGTEQRSETAFHPVAACLDGSDLGERILPHALAVARALGVPVTLLRVLEAEASTEAPPDPLEWDMRRRETREYVARIAEKQGEAENRMEAEVIEGQPAEEICRWTRDRGVGLTVLSSHGSRGATEWSLASTARKLVEGASGSLLLVPATAPVQQDVAHYRRILVPLDGSARAQSVIPLAQRLAEAQGAELILVHVVPVPEVTEIGPVDSEALELRERLVRHNERVANQYLDRLRAQVAEGAVPVRALVLRADDARGHLARVIADEGVDLVVLSAHGRSARADVPLGSMAAHLVAHAQVPLLIVRRRPEAARARLARASRGDTRLPSQATL